MNPRAVDAVFPAREKAVNRWSTLVNQDQRTQMNLGTLTQFERSENYVPKSIESSLQDAVLE